MAKPATKEHEMSLQAQIFNAMEGLPSKITIPDGSNIGARIANYALWKRASAIAEKKTEAALKGLIDDGIIKDPKEITTPGEHELCAGKSLWMKVNVSVAKRAFNPEYLCTLLFKDYKVPPLVTKQYLMDATMPGTSQTRTITVIDKSGTKV